MLVKDLMKTRIITVSPEESIEIAAREMVRFGISCLLVKDESRIVGVITERDLLTRVIAIGRDPNGLCVRDIMSTRLISVSPSASIDEATCLMMENRIKKLPVSDPAKAKGHNPVHEREGTETRHT
jgi:CBS domain-containing protein